VTASARTGLLAVGGLVVAGLVAELAGRRRLVRRRRRRDNPGRHRNPWITSRGHRVHIDDEGRVDAGGIPRQWHGAHIRDVSELGRRWREIDHEEEACATGGAAAPATFRSQDAGLAALYEANPHLVDFVQGEAKGAAERAYQRWVRGGRRGRKPTRAAGDGRFDAINEGLERRGARAVASWSEAVRAVVPPSRRWADFGGRLPLLEDATGLRLNLPGPAEVLELGGQRGAECEQLGEGARGRLVEEARAGRLTEISLEGVPF